MPWPKPKEGETQRECMSNEYIQQDLPEQDQRLAVCYQRWEDRDKGGSEMNIERKTFTGIELKKDKKGSFTAKIAELNVIDKDGDVTLPGAFPEGKLILISSYQHGSWSGELPVGKGTIHEKGDDVLVEGEFNLNSETGREHYETIKFAPDLQEWSYGFIVQEKEEDTEWEGNHVSRILKKLDVFEAAPVLRGAGMNTAVVAIKSEQTEPPEPEKENNEGMTFASQTEAALAAVEELVTRARSLADLRRKEGRNLSQTSIERLGVLSKQLTGLETEVKLLMSSGREAEKGKAMMLYLEFLKMKNEFRGVAN